MLTLGSKTMQKYSEKVEKEMLIYYAGLSEPQKRQYASLESEKLGWGGKTYISKLLGISQKTIRKGSNELENPDLLKKLGGGRQRRTGGGRKKKELKALEDLIHRYKAGSPTDSTQYWIHLKPRELADLYEQESGIRVSNQAVKRILRKLGFQYRKLSKNLATGRYTYRDEQFQIIFSLVLLMSLQSPILSIDCKKKERLGTLYRDGKTWSQSPVEVYDHDYEHLSEGKVIPHGIYDLQANKGYITIGTSHETAAFIAENLLWWWDEFGIHLYSDASTILILCDAGGANSYRHFTFKKAMLDLARQIGKDLIICHYPPYASKWNPIEHRLFAQTHHAIQGVVFDSYETVQMLFEKTSTTTGLSVVVRILDKKFETGIKVKKETIEMERIQFNPQIPELSYRIAA